MKYAYLLVLVSTLLCLVSVDRRFKLAFYYDRRRSWLTLITGIILFSFWDLAGIKLNIFYIGQTKFLSGIEWGQFPLEELFFLAVLCYCTLLGYRLFSTRNVRKQ